LNAKRVTLGQWWANSGLWAKSGPAEKIFGPLKKVS